MEFLKKTNFIAIIILALTVISCSLQNTGKNAMVDENGKPFTFPSHWLKNLKVPNKKTNCVRCHLGVGGVYSDSVIHFAESTHDYENLSCNDCHGGDTENDEYAHAQKGYLGTNPKEMAIKCAGCHPDPANIFKQSPHYQEKYNWQYPNCWQCHDDHSIGRGTVQMTKACTQCHGKSSIAVTGSGESEIIWKSRTKGVHGNSISIALTATGKNQPLSIDYNSSVDKTDITVYLETNEKGEPVSLAEEVIAMISNSKDFFHIIYTEEGDGALGEAVVLPTPRFSLTGGADFDDDLPNFGELIRVRDSLSESIQRLNKSRSKRPLEIVKSITALRRKTMTIIHQALDMPDTEKVKPIINETIQLKKTIDTWLHQPQPGGNNEKSPDIT